MAMTSNHRHFYLWIISNLISTSIRGIKGEVDHIRSAPSIERSINAALHVSVPWLYYRRGGDMTKYRVLAILWFVLLSVACATTFARNKTRAPSAPRIIGNVNGQSDDWKKPACPSDMVEIDGDYCPNEKQVCLYNTDIKGNKLPGPADLAWACGEYKESTCEGGKVHMHFCIDKYEWPNKEGKVPQDWMTYFDAQKAVASVGKRLCTHREWSLAAEGPNMHPLPYGDGFHRDSSLCNFDNHNPGIDVMNSKSPNDENSQKLRALLVPSGSKDCVSDFGVHDMAGNVDEWVVNESSQDLCINRSSGNCRSGLMGGHIWHVRNASRPMTTAHGAGFGWYETGTRACKDAE